MSCHLHKKVIDRTGRPTVKKPWASKQYPLNRGMPEDSATDRRSAFACRAQTKRGASHATQGVLVLVRRARAGGKRARHCLTGNGRRGRRLRRYRPGHAQPRPLSAAAALADDNSHGHVRVEHHNTGRRDDSLVRVQHGHRDMRDIQRLGRRRHGDGVLRPLGRPRHHGGRLRVRLRSGGLAAGGHGRAHRHRQRHTRPARSEQQLPPARECLIFHPRRQRGQVHTDDRDVVNDSLNSCSPDSDAQLNNIGVDTLEPHSRTTQQCIRRACTPAFTPASEHRGERAGSASRPLFAA